MLAAIAAVRRAVAAHADATQRDRSRSLAAIRHVGGFTRSQYAEQADRLIATIGDRLSPHDPLRQTWNTTRAFGVEDDEVRWTKWLAALLRPENGARSAHVAWTALCDAVARRIAERPLAGEDPLLDESGWRAMTALAPEVHDEVRHPTYGQLDLLVTTASAVIAIENKLLADWHDSDSGKQADRYRSLARERLGSDPARRLGLVLLSQRDGLRAGEHYPLDYVHVSWRDFGRSLRRALPPRWWSDVGAAIGMWPVIQMLVSIEQDLLDLNLAPLDDVGAKPMVRISQLTRLARYLDDR